MKDTNLTLEQIEINCTNFINCTAKKDIDKAVKMKLSLEVPEYCLIREKILIIKALLSESPSDPPFIQKAALHTIPQLVEAYQQTARELSEAQGGGDGMVYIEPRRRMGRFRMERYFGGAQS